MMRQTNTFGYAEGDNYQAVELPYDGGELSMVVLLPTEGKYAEFEDTLDYKRADMIIDNLKDKRVKLTMPKFEFESEFRLKQTLSTLGMPLAFSESADFSGMASERDPLFIGDVIHKAFVSVDEGGTEAAAATAVIMFATSAPGPKPEEPVIVTIDRPFIFLIRDIETGAILFIGRVLNPAA